MVVEIYVCKNIFPAPHILKKVDLELCIPCTICVFAQDALKAL